jgi:hypothetical protein
MLAETGGDLKYSEIYWAKVDCVAVQIQNGCAPATAFTPPA